MTTERLQEYLETLYKMNENGEMAKTSEIANQLNIAPASVSEMLRKMANEGYIEYESYKGARLTKRVKKSLGRLQENTDSKKYSEKIRHPLN